MTPEEIVKENFKGFDDIIKSKTLRDWYKDLIITCLEHYAAEKDAQIAALELRLKELGETTMEIIKND